MPLLSTETRAFLALAEETVFTLDQAEIDLSNAIKRGHWSELPPWAKDDINGAVSQILAAGEAFRLTARMLDQL